MLTTWKFSEGFILIKLPHHGTSLTLLILRGSFALLTRTDGSSHAKTSTTSILELGICIAGLNAALYSGPHIRDLDKLLEYHDTAKPPDDYGDFHPLRCETDLSGRLLDSVEGAISWRKNTAGRRVYVDSTGSEIRRGSRRPVGRVSTHERKKIVEGKKERVGAPC